MKKVAKNLYISTDDGSYGFDGRVTDCLIDLVENQGKKYDHAIVIGPMIMMKFMSALTKKLEIKTTVSLNPIMLMEQECVVHAELLLEIKLNLHV